MKASHESAEEKVLAEKASKAMKTFEVGLPVEDQQVLAPMKPHVGIKSRRRPSDVFNVYGLDVLET